MTVGRRQADYQFRFAGAKIRKTNVKFRIPSCPKGTRSFRIPKGFAELNRALRRLRAIAAIATRLAADSPHYESARQPKLKVQQ